jgi:hypothetical protein
VAKTKEIELTKAEVEARGLATGALHNAMNSLMAAVIECDEAGIPLADAFAEIGMEIPRFLQPMVNQLAEKLPSRNPDFVADAT